jgi:1,4-dihydroxy-2-naphthoyl-CoA synthase
MSEPSVIVAKDARGIATVAINRPQVRNAIDDTVIRSLTDAFNAHRRSHGAWRRVFGRRRSRLDAPHGGGQRSGEFGERKNDQRNAARAQ